MPATAAAATYDYDGRTITLPQGGIQKGYDPRIGQEIVHGFGWALIAEQTELSKDEVGDVFASDPVSRQPGEIEYVIGDIVSRKDAVILSILGGFLLAGQEARSVTDGTDECREVGYTDDKVEHASRDEKGIDHSDVLDAISNPDSFGQGESLYYIRKIEGKGWYVVRVLKDVPFKFADKFKYWMSTSLIDQRTGDLYESLDDAKDAMEDEDEDVTWNDDPRGCN